MHEWISRNLCSEGWFDLQLEDHGRHEERPGYRIVKIFDKKIAFFFLPAYLNEIFNT